MSIHNTTAGIIQLGYGISNQAQIIRLGNDIGETFVKLYHPEDNGNLPAIVEQKGKGIATRSKPFIGITFVATAQVNMIKFKSTFKAFKLSRGDQAGVKFEDETIMTFTFGSPASNMGAYRMNFAPLTDYQLSYFADNAVKEILITDESEEFVNPLSFIPNARNIQYSTYTEGQELLKKAAQVVAGAKLELTSKIT